VDIGQEELSIVCGAPNIKKGQMIPVALVGAILPNGMEIKKAEVRGEFSSGMLCAEDELSLGDDHGGIMILENNAKIGQNLADYLKIKDVIFEVDNKSITNRPDLWGHLGMAREISVFLNTKTTKKFKNLINPKKEKGINKLKLEVKVEDFDLCPRYMAVGLKNIKVASSPKWLEERLIAVGIKPINNIVDISNYVMMEFGQPMHAFDFHKISEDEKNAKIIIRKASKNEIIKTLDDEERKLDSEMLLIANKKNPIAIAGVMGGEGSGINDDTSSIIFESANFNYASIRKTSTKLNLRTDASMRYEKSLDPSLCEGALYRAIELSKEVCPEAEIVTEIIDVSKYKLEQGPIKFTLSWLNKFLGFNLDSQEIIDILTKLGFSLNLKEDELEIIVPSFRATKDISRKEDIAEELARIYGYDRIMPMTPKVEMKPPFILEEKKIINKIKEVLVFSNSFSESYNYSFVGEEDLKKMGINYDSYISLANPISKNHTLLRQTLIPGLLSNVKTNQARFEEIMIFEIGNIFLNLEGSYSLDDKNEEQLPFQEKKIAFVIAQNEGDLILKAKGVLENLFENLDLNFEFDFMENVPLWADRDCSAFILINGSIVGFLAKINMEIAKKIGLKKNVIALELNLKKIMEVLGGKERFKFKEFEKFPPLIRDLAFVLGEKIVYKDLRNDIINFHEHIKNVELFDIYAGDKLGLGKKSLAFHIIYQASKTLSGEEVEQIQKELISFLEKKYEAQIRDF
jgi:phenylalanyl-tRNA synthetase beta chain